MGQERLPTADEVRGILAPYIETTGHPVWPEGPPCAAECPGDWSEWHYGYSAGYEAAGRVSDEVQ